MIIAGDPVRIIPPAALPISLAEFKAQTRVSSSDEDALMMGYIRAATELCENWTSMGFITQTWQQTFSSFPDSTNRSLVLWRRPVQSVSQVSYLDSAGVSQILDASVYRVAGIGWDKTSAQIWQASSGSAWPVPIDFLGSVTVTYVVGFGNSHNDVPELIRQAIMMAASTFYSYREDVVEGFRSVTEIPSPSKVLLTYWRNEPVV